jgi:starvation-inducible DNA-binding protein
MEQLVHEMKVLQASTFALYLKTHNYHWNVEGVHFPQFHGFFEDLYNELWSAVDPIAENIRKLGAFAPGSLTRFAELSIIEDELKIPTALDMVAKIHDDNEKVIGLLYRVYEFAEGAQELGLSNFIQDRIDVHKKHAWMLRSILRRN